MNRAGIADRVARGYGIAARVVGDAYRIHRPSPTGIAIGAATYVGEVFAAFSDDLSFARRERWGEVAKVAVLDLSRVAVGDYLTGAGGTFFVSALPAFGPPQVVACNRVLTVTRPSPGAAGDAYYGGDVRAAEVALLSGWPGAVAQAGGLAGVDIGLPGDARAPGWTIYLPASASAQLRASDVVEDDQARPMRYIIGSAEETDMGWRLRAQQAVA